MRTPREYVDDNMGYARRVHHHGLSDGDLSYGRTEIQHDRVAC